MNQTSETYEPVFVFRVLLLAAIVVLGSLAATGIYRRYTGLTRWQSALLCLLASGSAIGYLIYLDWHRGYYGYQGEPQPFIHTVIFVVPLSLLTIPFAVRLYRKWIGGQLTDAEKLPGVDGVRAWLTPGNLICAIFIPICAWQVFQVSLPAMFALTFGLLLAYPIFNMAFAAPAAATPPENLSGEREKVLQLLEAGKITADESADLLNALSHSATPPAKPAAEINPQRKMVLVGAALLLVGFFLPWFAINPGDLLKEMTAQVQQNMGGMMPANALPQISAANGTMQIHAGNLANGLGWWILALGIGAAVLPFFATTLEAALQKEIILAALGVGVFLLIFLLSYALRYASIGVVLALAGYVLEVVGTLKERPSAH